MAACSGDEAAPPVGGGSIPPDGGSPTEPVVVPSGLHALVISLDGATYSAVQAGLADGSLPNLAKMQTQLAYSGGMFGTLSQQPSLDAPGWATLLTGSWGERHQVLSDFTGQAMKASSVFEMLKSSSSSTRLTGAAVNSVGLSSLLKPLFNSGSLDTLIDCSAEATADTCITNGVKQMIGARYGVVMAQYHGAADAALNYGQSVPKYAAALARLDANIGTLVAETAKDPANPWLIVVTGNHGLSINSQSDGLPLVPEATTFIALSKGVNTAAGVGAAIPGSLSGLYAYPSIADVAPTVLAYVNALPANADYAMAGGQLIDVAPVQQLAGAMVADISANTQSIVLNWVAPASGTISVLRNGKVIASDLAAGTSTYTDTSESLQSDYPEAGTYRPRYTVVVAGKAARSVVVSFKFTPPVPLSINLKNSLMSYYPAFASPLNAPITDAFSHSTLAPWSANANGGSLVPDPFGNQTGALQVDAHMVDGVSGMNGYRLLPGTGSYNAAYDAVASGSFTVGFWYNAPCLKTGVANSPNVVGGSASVVNANHTYPIFGNKNYITGNNAGVQIGLNTPAGSTGSGCNLVFNIGDGVPADRVDPSGPQGASNGIAYTPNTWVYVAMTVDTIAKTFTNYIYDPVLGKRSNTLPINTFDFTKLPGLANGYGLLEDGTGRMTVTICGAPQNGLTLPTLSSGVYTATTCGHFPPSAVAFSDLAMWNAAISAADLDTIFASRKPLSTLLP